MSDLRTDLKTLGLHTAADHLDDLIAVGTRQRLSAVEVLEHLVATELKDRARRSLERRTTRAQLGRFKPVADFDWTWPRAIDRELVESALRLEFLTEPRNVVLVAPQGLGKTMLAQNIAHQAVLAGHSVLFTTVAKMLVDLGGVQSTPHLFQQRLRKYTRVGLLCCDEVGYLSYDARAADLLFQVVSERHEKRPLVLTTSHPHHKPCHTRFDPSADTDHRRTGAAGAHALAARTCGRGVARCTTPEPGGDPCPGSESGQRACGAR